MHFRLPSGYETVKIIGMTTTKTAAGAEAGEAPSPVSTGVPIEAVPLSALPGHAIAPEKNFRWRAGEITRLDALCDVVFGFAITLRAVSLEVRPTYAELMG